MSTLQLTKYPAYKSHISGGLYISVVYFSNTS